MSYSAPRTSLALTVACSLLAAGGCRRAPSPPPTPPDVTAEFTALRDRCFVRHLELNPVTSTYLGGSGYSPQLRLANGRLRDYSAAALADELRFYAEVRQALSGIDASRLPDMLRIDAGLVQAQIAFLLRETGERKYYERAVDTYVAEPFRGVDWQIQQMQDLSAGLLGSEDEWALVASRVEGIPRYLDVAQANLASGKRSGNLPDRRMVQLDGIQGARANAAYFRTTLPELAGSYIGARPFGASLLARLRAAGDAAARSWDDFGAFLGQTFDVTERVDRFAAGQAEYEWRVREVLRDPRSAAELYDYGAEQVAFYTGQIVEAARTIAAEAGLNLPFGTDSEKTASTRAVMAHLSKDSPASDEDLFDWYRGAADRAVAYGRAQSLFEIPAEYRLDIVPTPPVLQSSIDAAYYPAPPFMKSGVGRFYLTPTGNDKAKLALNNRASVADTAVHEGFPGHDWHYKYMTQHAAGISNIRWLTPGAVEDSSSMWSDSMASEGWALYAEELMAEPAPGRPHGFYSAGEHFYELQGQLLRAVRVRVDVGLHTGRMSFDQATEYFVDRVSFYPGACGLAGRDKTAAAVCDQAEHAIYRYSKWPTQAITYNLGKNTILSLREAERKQLGARFSARRFHERFMGMGTVPPGHFREAFLSAAGAGGSN
jgi:uncharacterized protein (DUF885 family)